VNRGPSEIRLPLAGVLAKWDAVTIRWGLDGEECSSLLGGGIAGPVADVSTYDPASAEQRMRLVIELEAILASVFADEGRTREWLRRDNSSLGGRTPLEMMARSPTWIRWFIDALGIAA
jgi:hypothetical protein